MDTQVQNKLLTTWAPPDFHLAIAIPIFSPYNSKDPPLGGKLRCLCISTPAGWISPDLHPFIVSTEVYLGLVKDPPIRESSAHRRSDILAWSRRNLKFSFEFNAVDHEAQGCTSRIVNAR